MSNEVVSLNTRPPLTAGERPKAIVPTDMESAYRLAKAVCAAGMAPKGLETPEKAMIAIMRGLEVGMTPFMALDKIAIVNGRPTIWGDGALGLVRGSGVCEWIKEKIEGEGDNRVAICEAKRRSEPESIRRTFSVADAKQAGLWGKAGPWQQYPERMLQMRARAFALRDLFADVLGGLYLREEFEETPPAPRPPQAEQPIQDRRRAPVVEDELAMPSLETIDYAAVVETFRQVALDASDTDQLDAAWLLHITPHKETMPRELYEEAAAFEDQRRGFLE